MITKWALSKKANSYFHFLQIIFTFAWFVWVAKVGIFMIETRQSKLGRIRTNMTLMEMHIRAVSWVLENKSLLVPAATHLSIKITSLCFCLLWFAFIPQEDASLFELALQETLYKILMPSSFYLFPSQGATSQPKLGPIMILFENFCWNSITQVQNAWLGLDKINLKQDNNEDFFPKYQLRKLCYLHEEYDNFSPKLKNLANNLMKPLK